MHLAFADFDFYHGTDTGSNSTASVEVNKFRHRWIKNWFIKAVLPRVGASSWTNTSDLTNNLDYYQTRKLKSSEIEIVDDTYNYLWEIESVPGLEGASETIKKFSEDVAFAHQSDYRLKAADVSHLTIFHDSDQFNNGLIASLASVGVVGDVDYARFSSDYLLALERAADEVAELFIRTVPYLEDDLLSKITVRDTRLQNIDLSVTGLESHNIHSADF